jgi:hypothetical protein
MQISYGIKNTYIQSCSIIIIIAAATTTTTTTIVIVHSFVVLVPSDYVNWSSEKGVDI